MPKAERTHKANQDFIIVDIEFFPRSFTPTPGIKEIWIHRIGIDANSIRLDPSLDQIIPEGVGNDDDPGRGSQCHLLAPSDPAAQGIRIPVVSHPEFRAVVFQNEWDLQAS